MITHRLLAPAPGSPRRRYALYTAAGTFVRTFASMSAAADHVKRAGGALGRIAHWRGVRARELWLPPTYRHQPKKERIAR